MHFLLLALVLAPQEPAPVDVEKLHEELHAKVVALKALSAKLTLESVDDKGVSTVRYSGAFHCRPAEGWLYFEMKDPGSKEPNSIMFERFSTIRTWREGGPGATVDLAEANKYLWRSLWEVDQARSRVMDEPRVPSSFEAYASSLKPLVFVELDPSEPGSPEPASFRVGTAKSSRRGVSWLTALLKKSRVTAGKDEVTVVESDPSRTSVIDRRTGWLRSMSLHLPGGTRRLNFTEVVPEGPQTALKLPEKWIDRPATVLTELTFTIHGVRTNVESDIERFLKDWDRAGREDRIEALRAYFSRAAVEFKTWIRCHAQVYWASEFVKEAVARGDSLDDVQKELEEKAEDLETYLDQGNDSHGEILNERMAKFRKDLETVVDKAPAGDAEARRQMKVRIQEGFQSERRNKLSPSYPDPAPERLLKEAIQAARLEEKK